MKILYIAPAANPHSIRWIENLYACIGYGVFDITWVSFERPRHEEALSGKNFSVDYIYLPRDFFKLFLTKKDYDFCHVQSLARYLLPLFFLYNHRIRLILTAWGSDIYAARKNRIIKWLQDIMFRQASALTGDSKEMCNCLEDISRSRCVYRINFGTDCNVYKPNSIFLGIPNESVKSGKYILSTRNFYPVYDIGTLIKAYSLLQESQRIEYPLILVGKGPEREVLISLAASLGIKDNLIMPGYIPYNQLPSIYSNCTAYISTALSDAGLAASTAEAMACGALSIVTNVKENSAWVSESLGTGYLFEPGDYISLHKYIHKLICISISERNHISENARRMIYTYSNSVVESAKFLNIINSIKDF